MNCEEAKKLLDAFLDHELDLSKHLELENHLKECPRCKVLADHRAKAKTLLRENLKRHPAPSRLREKILADLREETPQKKIVSAPLPFPRWLWGAGIASAAALLMAGVFFWSGQSESPLLAEAIADHSRSLLANHLMDVASTDQHTVRPWFTGKIDYSPPVVDLTATGFPLIGGRLDMLDGQPVAAIVYQRRKHYINLFIWPATMRNIGNVTAFKNGYHVRGWEKSGLNYLAVSEIGDLNAFVDEIQKGTD